MTRKYATYLVVIATLAVVNLWRWGMFPQSSGKHDVTNDNGFSAEEFRLHVDASRPASPERDLFRSADKNIAKISEQNVHRPTAIQPTVPPPETATITPTDADIGKLKLLGVVFRGGAGQAYLAFDKENAIAHSGETVLGRFAVVSIDVDSVNLTDLKTNTSRRISVSGK